MFCFSKVPPNFSCANKTVGGRKQGWTVGEMLCVKADCFLILLANIPNICKRKKVRKGLLHRSALPSPAPFSSLRKFPAFESWTRCRSPIYSLGINTLKISIFFIALLSCSTTSYSSPGPTLDSGKDCWRLHLPALRTWYWLS